MALGVALLLSTCNVERQAESPLNGTTSSPASAADSAKALAVLPTIARSNGDSEYRRESFGRPWHDVDGNGCNQRDDVLLRDAVPGTARSVRQGACGHDVIAGTWLDPYTGISLTFSDLKEPAQAQAIQIDHLVPLAEAWVSGASSWSAEQRERYANDRSEEHTSELQSH